MGDYWQRFWEGKGDPLHHLDEMGYDLMAKEYLCLIGQAPYRSVLELACGSGELYERLGFDGGAYTGVDISANMLGRFRERYSGLNLVTADVRSFVPDQPVDLVVSSGLLQYLPPSAIDQHLGNVVAKLNPGGRILHLGATWDALRWSYYAGTIDGRDSGLLRRVKGGLAAVAELAGVRPVMGYWHSMSRLRRIAATHGLDTTFYGSIVHPYRFHVRFVVKA